MSEWISVIDTLAGAVVGFFVSNYCNLDQENFKLRKNINENLESIWKIL